MHLRWPALILLSIFALTLWGCGGTRRYHDRYGPVYGPVYGQTNRGRDYQWERDRRMRQELRRLQRRQERLRRLERQHERSRERYERRRYRR